MLFFSFVRLFFIPLVDTEITLDFCVFQPDLCIVYSDGYAIKGVLQLVY